MHLGPNAVRVLKAVGVLDELLKKIDPAELRTRGFVYYYGVGEHKRILAVSLPMFTLRLDTSLTLTVV